MIPSQSACVDTPDMGVNPGEGVGGAQYALWGDTWLPRAPLASSRKDGSYKRMSRDKAMLMPYIEANPTALCSLIITDHDGGAADEIASLAGLPEPSYTVLNPYTRSGHIVYALASPVCLTDAAKRRPINLLARIESGLVNILDGDIAYAGRITKNPYHQEHLPLFTREHTLIEKPATTDSNIRVYALKELAEPLAALKALPKYNHSKPQESCLTSTIGRNCALFDITRKWSYRHRGYFSIQNEWEHYVFAKAYELNETIIAENFTKGPLTTQETTHIARSISRWTWRNITRTFQQEQARKGKKGGHKGGQTRKLPSHAPQEWIGQ